MDPIGSFHSQVALSACQFAAHALRLLDGAGLLDDHARRAIRGNLELIQKNADAVTDAVPEAEIFNSYVNMLVEVLPLTQSFK